MVSDGPVREIGRVADVYDRTVLVGIDHEAVTIGSYVLGPEVRDDLMRLLFAAGEAAKAYSAAAGDGEDEVSPVGGSPSTSNGHAAPVAPGEQHSAT